MHIVTPKQMRTIEENADRGGLSFLRMMENAGRSVYDSINHIVDKADLSKPVIVLCGKGNNGGDGFVCARLLSQAGLQVSVVLTSGEPIREDAMRNYMELCDSGAEVLGLEDNIDKVFGLFSSCGLVIDAVFGSGFHGELPPAVKACFSFVSRTDAYKIAVDVPSGGNCLTGAVSEGTLKVGMTVTFAYKKVGTELYPLCEYCGDIVVTNIGIKSSCTRDIPYIISEADNELVTSLIPKRNKYSYKGNFGRLVNFSGSRQMPGAAALSTRAALRSGAGLVTLASPSDVTSALSSSIHECTYLPLKQTADGFASISSSKTLIDGLSRATAVSIGCGLGVCEDTIKLVSTVLEKTECPIILDADGINCISKNIDGIGKAAGRLLVTPHAAELARLLNVSLEEVLSDRLSAAITLAERYNISVLVKGMPTFVVGQSRAYIIKTGNPGLSRGGSGDVLTGIIAALAAQSLPLTEAAAVGAFIFGTAADRTADLLSMQGMLPSDVIAELPATFRQFGL